MRVLACIDAVPAADGTCAEQAWMEQASFADLLPTVGEAHEVGIAFAFSLITIAAVKRFLKPQRY